MPKLEPLKEFICDECGEIIQEPNDGWVEWLVYQDEEKDDYCQINYNFRIVHQSEVSPKGTGSCNFIDLYQDYKGTESTSNLKHFLEDKGVAQTLGILQEHGMGYKKFKDNESFLQFLNLIRRVTIPYFEEGRLYLEEYYLKFTGESTIIYDRLNGEEMKNFLEWIEDRGYDYSFR